MTKDPFADSFGNTEFAEVEHVKKWSDLFAKKVDLMANDIKSVASSVASTDSKINICNERNARKNNIIVFNLVENSHFSKAKDKEIMSVLFNALLPETDISKEISDCFRLGKLTEENQRPRPLLIKLSGYSLRTKYWKVASKDREECKKLISEKKNSISSTEDINKFVFFIKGHPGDFYAVARRKKEKFSVRNKSSINSTVINDFMILYANVDTLTNKFVELKFLLDSCRSAPKLIFLNEVNPKYYKIPPSLSEFQLNGYQVISKGFAVKDSRGLLVYFCNDLPIAELILSSSFHEYICVQLSLKLIKLKVLSLYRSPGSSDLNNILLLQLLDEFLKLPGFHLILGDFNLPDINWGFQGSTGPPAGINNMFLNFINDNFLKQHIDQPTRARGTRQPHILDLVITDVDIIKNISCLAPMEAGDHSVLSMEVCGFHAVKHSDIKKFC
ncbi:hypothetical protein HELRODRAFT_166802 [Helobdella robusta]|uniref:Endonuclease/exonuclease/phosphatase domain-containing protein n=1 Tax=Helobdella robusta TaxID=6412 RepID=T1EYJ7_HELRO|nr:hypothetical protein HELRODRAFT_166802 [Helobdella robusta]ESO11765.1 hypothetical protein HELRODRAFT_166802 [Helobdella robusta]